MIKTLALAALMIFSGFSSADILNRNTSEYNLGPGLLGLKGYDPVSYFQGQPLAGSPDITYEHSGVVYRFANEANKQEFMAKANMGEPTYGGWCAWAMFKGSKIDIDPEIYTLTSEGRLHFFVNQRAKRNFDRDIANHEAVADDNWEGFSGEVYVQP